LVGFAKCSQQLIGVKTFVSAMNEEAFKLQEGFLPKHVVLFLTTSTTKLKLGFCKLSDVWYRQLP
jgi:hypothetical protein